MEFFFLPIGGGNEIGASSYFLQIGNTKLLLDAGIRINTPIVFPKYNILYQQNIIDGLWDLDAILISHGHLDHCGALPYVHSEAGKVPIYATKQTKQIAKLLLSDTSKIEKQNFGDTNIQLYNKLLVDETIDWIRETEFYNSFEIGDVKITFFPAGHILGAAMIFIENELGNILFTGDYSSFSQFTVPKYDIPHDLAVDILITETTYGYQNLDLRQTFKQERELFLSQVYDTIVRGGTVLIPAFAIGRTQELALLFSDYFSRNPQNIFPVYIGGLAAEACTLYQNNGINLYNKIIMRAPYSKKRILNSLIIASSGMLLEKTTSAQFATLLLNDPKNTIYFSGYLDEESPGKALSSLEKKKNKLYRLNGKQLEVNANISTYRLSAHTNIEGIKELTEKTDPKQIIFIHGFPNYGNQVNILNEFSIRFNDKHIAQSMNGVKIYL